MPQKPIILTGKPLDTWSPTDVLAFLEANKEQYYLDDKDISRIHNNKVCGEAFIQLTKEELLKEPYKLPGGPATMIETLVKQLTLLLRPTLPEASEGADILVSPTRYTLISKTSSLRPSEQTLDHFENGLKRELRGLVCKDVEGLYPCLFQNVSLTDLSLYGLPAPTNFAARPSDDSTTPLGTIYEDNVKRWLINISAGVRSQHASVTSYFYPSGTITVSNSHLGSLRKPDIVLTPKLEDEDSHQSACNNRYKHSWRDVLVVGEVKLQAKKDATTDTTIQLASYAREMLAAQPGRRFAHCFTLCGQLARFWLFDRIGACASARLDISGEDGQRNFMHGLVSYMRMSPSQMGFDDRYLDSQGNTFYPGSTIPKEPLPTYLVLSEAEGNVKKFQLRKILSYTASIASRGTLCWEAEGADGQVYVIKSAWRDGKLKAEAHYWQMAKTEGVPGCLDIAIAMDGDVTSSTSHETNNIRMSFDYTKSKVISMPIKNERLEEITEEHDETIIQAQPETTTGTKRVQKYQLSPRVSKKSKSSRNSPPTLTRIHSFMVTRTIGLPLTSSIKSLALVETLRDAICCHRSLYEKAHILHCDISTSNVMMTRPEDRAATDLAGFLIDLDYSQLVVPAAAANSELSSASCGKTGTLPFLAIDLLVTPKQTNTWRHDLESFFYVLLWMCVDNPARQFQEWSGPTCANVKRDRISSEFEEILAMFRDECAPLKDLARAFREVLFVERAVGLRAYIGTPTESGRVQMYDRTIAHFDSCIMALKELEKKKKKEEEEKEGEGNIAAGREGHNTDETDASGGEVIPGVEETSADAGGGGGGGGGGDDGPVVEQSDPPLPGGTGEVLDAQEKSLTGRPQDSELSRGWVELPS